jgi:protein ImuB
VPALPLQLFAARHPDWRGAPAAVVDRDAPHGEVLWSNERARRSGVLAGLRYSAALALCAELRAGTVAAEEIEAGVARLAELLRRFSPEIEPSQHEPGVFWADLSGLELLHPTRIAWCKSVRAALAEAGFEGAVAAGSRRFTCYAIAKALRGARVLVLEDARDEEALARRVPLERIGLEPRVRDDLGKLAVRTVGDLVRLPVESLLLRFGPNASRLHALASGALVAPLEPEHVALPPRASIDLDFPLADVEQVLFVVEELARPLLRELAAQGRAVRALAVHLAIERGGAVEISVEPAEATLDLAQLTRLLRMKLENQRLARGAEQVVVELTPAPATREQLRLFAQRPGRDPRAAAQAFAALRAAFGEDVVVRAVLQPVHLPEARFRWERAGELAPPRPRDVAEPPLVRRLYAKPLTLPTRSRHEEDGWMLRGVTHGPVAQLHGPYFLSGGWWRAYVERDYHFAEMQSGEIFWIYFDRRRRRWFLQGSVS